jgi:hypothetical protein
MAKVTLDIPDELMAQLAEMGEDPSNWLRQQLPELVQAKIQPSTPPNSVYRYILDFITSTPTPQQIAEFRPTPEMQLRLQSLLELNQSGQLTPSRQAELDEYQRIEHIVIMLKAGNLKNLVGQA